MVTRARAFCPVTVANVAVGFDSLGLAVAPENGELWGDEVEAHVQFVEENPSKGAEVNGSAGEITLRVEGAHRDKVPARPEDNLVTLAVRHFYRAWQEFKGPQPVVALTLRKNLPVASGLGSSASSSVAALCAINACHGNPFSPKQLVSLAGETEGHVSGSVHYDNVAPALLGGLQLIASKSPLSLLRLPFPDELRVVVAEPALQLSTHAARAILPRDVGLPVAIEYGQRLAAFVHALHLRDWQGISQSMRDVIAEPYRASLVPGFAEAKAAALQAGALACSLSGSGPAVFAVTQSGALAEDVALALVAGFAKQGVHAATRICVPCERGARVLFRESET